MSSCRLIVFALLLAASTSLPAQSDRVVYQGDQGPGLGKKIVLITGDEEYRSEEGLTQLGKILAELHGFRSTVLFALDPETGIINPHIRDNIPGLETLDDADLVVILTRWRTLPDAQMEHIGKYLQAGKPVVALRTATHGFAPPQGIHDDVLGYLRQESVAARAGDPSPTPPSLTTEQWGRFGHYGDGYFGPQTAWRDGFGRLVVGERWVAHHGHHKHESTLGLLAPGTAGHPILRGLADGDIWGPSDVYAVRLPLPGDSVPLVMGQVMERRGAYDETDAFYGMRPSDGPPVAGKNEPMMPVAWTKSYELPGGHLGRVFATTMGSSTDLVSAGVRRLILNGVYWALGMGDQIPAEGVAAELVGPFEPTGFNNHPPEYWLERQLRPSDFRME
jgi:hypothetical protein